MEVKQNKMKHNRELARRLLSGSGGAIIRNIRNNEEYIWATTCVQ